MARLLGPSEEILLSIIETGEVPSNYNQEQAQNSSLEQITKKISHLVRKFADKLKARTLTSSDAFYTKTMILTDLMVLAAVLEKKLESDVIDAAVQKAGETAAPRLGSAIGGLVSSTVGSAAAALLTGFAAIGGGYLSIKQMISDNEEKQRVAALLDSVFGGRRISKFKKKERLKMFRRRHRWVRTNKVISQPIMTENNEKKYQKVTEKQVMNSEKILEEYILHNKPQQIDTSVIEVIADEVNEALSNLPEIELASQVLNEDELKELFSPFAKKIVFNVHEKMPEHVKKLVEAEIDDALLAKIASLVPSDALSDQEQQTLYRALPTGALTVDTEKLQNIAEQGD